MNSAAPIRVLLVDHAAERRQVLCWMMRQVLADFDFVEAGGVEVAMRHCADMPPDLIVLDGSLPLLELLLASVAEQTRELRVPVLLVTTGEARTGRLSVDEAGISDIVSRDDLSPGLLRRIVMNALEFSSLRLALGEQGREIERLHEELAQWRHQCEALTHSRSGLAEEMQEFEASQSRAEESPAIVTAPLVPASVSEGTTADEKSSGINARSESGSAMASASRIPQINDDAVATERRTAPPAFLRGAEQASLTLDDETARRIQKGLMPSGSPLMEGVDIAGFSLPAETIGGDYFDYLPMADDILTISIGECSGRGIAPGMLMASVRAYLRVLAGTTSDISDILSRTNQLITQDVADEEFLITLLLLQYDPLAKSVRYASAGLQAHLIDRDGQSHVLPSTGMPMGLRAETIIPEGEPHRFRPGDILLLTTDGLAKTASPNGEPFGTKRVLELVNQNRHLPSRVIVNYLHRALLDFAGEHSPSDDITMILIKAER